MNGIGALYVHVPFCAKKCAYCDFASDRTAASDPCMEIYVDGVFSKIRELTVGGMLDTCKTAYVGGGTPTFLGARLLSTLIDAIVRACPQLEELTFEANPDSLTDEVIAQAIDAGATRVSVGVQSLDDRELVALGRIHTAEQARERVSAAVATPLSVSIDLMCAIPHQTEESWLATLSNVVSLGPDHVSVYPLSLEEGTPLGERYAHTDPSWNDEDVQASRMEQAEALLESAGYARYEVASYARPGHECLHNQAYWTGISYLGLGTGAASMLSVEQYASCRSVFGLLPEAPKGTYRVRVYNGDKVRLEFLNKQQAWAEDLMLGMRLCKGVALTDVPDEVLRELSEKGLVVSRAGRMAPTHEGWLLGNELYGTLWDLAESSVTEVCC